MNEAAKNLREMRRFSVGWCVGVAVLHFAGTLALAGMSFLTGMGSFTWDVSSEVAFWQGVLWLWTPLAMSIWNPQDMHQDAQLIGLVFLWSSCIGIGAGLCIPLAQRHQTHTRKTVSLPFLLIGYAAILCFGAQEIANWNAPVIPGFGVMFPIYCFGLALLCGYSQQVAGKAPWGKPVLFWSISAAFNALPFAEIALEHWSKISVPAYRWSHPSFLDDVADTYRCVFDYWRLYAHKSTFCLTQFSAQVIALFWMPVGCLLSIFMLLFERHTRNVTNEQNES